MPSFSEKPIVKIREECSVPGTYTVVDGACARTFEITVDLTWKHDCLIGTIIMKRIGHPFVIHARSLQHHLETQKIQQDRTAYTIQRDVLNAFATYENALFVMQAQLANLATTQRNFDRTNEMYKQGQVTSIEFRLAQLNMLNAESAYSQAKYNTKNAELQLKQLAGVLLEE